MFVLKKIKIFLFVITAIFITNFAYSQSGSSLRINEILVHNDSNYVDDFGQREGWIEIFNSAYHPANLGGMYITNDSTNPKKYWIPAGDPRTVIAPRNYLVLYADNKPTHGILHLNFKLDETNYLALYDVNGRTKVDEIRFGDQNPDISFGRKEDGSEQWVYLEKTTPQANNFTGVIETSGEKFLTFDPYGVGMAVIAMSVVFSALIILYLIFKHTKGIYSVNFKELFSKRKEKAVVTKTEDMPGEVSAAIAMTINLYSSALHDDEDTVLTIKKVSRTYSPWSSKIYSVYKKQQ